MARDLWCAGRLMLWAALVSCSAPAPPPPIEPADDRGRLEGEENVVVEGDLPGPRGEERPHEGKLAQATKPAASPGFKLPAELEVLSLGGGGDALFASLGRFHSEEAEVTRITRAGAQLSHRGPVGGRVRVLSESPELAIVTGAAGGIALYESGAWSYRLAPALEGERVTGVVRAADGRLFVAGIEQAVYELAGDDWKTHRYPSSGNQISEMVLARDGTIFLFGVHGRVITFKGGAFRDEKIPNLGTGPFVSSWVDSKRDEVWLAGAKRIAKVSLAAKMALALESPLFFDIKAIAGVDTTRGPLLLASSFGRVALFDGSDWSLVNDSGADGVYVDAAKSQAYLIGSRRIDVVDLKHPWLGTGPGVPFTR